MDNDSVNTSDALAKLTKMLSQGLQAAHYKKINMLSDNVFVSQEEESFKVWKEHTF